MYTLQTFMVFQILFSSLSKHAEIKKPGDFYIYVQLQIVISLFAATTPFFYHLEVLNLLKTTLKIEKLLISLTDGQNSHQRANNEINFKFRDSEVTQEIYKDPCVPSPSVGVS